MVGTGVWGSFTLEREEGTGALSALKDYDEVVGGLLYLVMAGTLVFGVGALTGH